MGIPPKEFDSKGTRAVDWCPKLLPVFKERLQRQQNVMEAYDALQSTCFHPISRDSETGMPTSSAPDVLEIMKRTVQMCEQTLRRKNE